MSYLNVSSVIPANRKKVFDFLCDVRNWPKLVPNNYELRLISPYMPVKKGAELEFELKRFGVPQIWSVKIDQFETDKFFVERQTLGMFNSWTNSFEFEDHGPDGCKLSNLIRYEPILGLFGRIIDDLWTRKEIERVFVRGHENLKNQLLTATSRAH